MQEQKRRNNIQLISLLISLCLFVLNQQEVVASSGYAEIGAATSGYAKIEDASDDYAKIGDESGDYTEIGDATNRPTQIATNRPTQTATDEYAQIVRKPPTLEDLAELHFLWAERALEGYKRGGVSQSSAYAASAGQYLTSGFYNDLGFQPEDLDRVKEVARRIQILFQTDGLSQQRAIRLVTVDVVPDIMRLYNILSKHPETGQVSIHPEHKVFIENLAQALYMAATSENLDELEMAGLELETRGILTKLFLTDDKVLERIRKPTIVHSIEDLTVVRKCPLIDYIHPINTLLYQHGLSCIYEADKKTFVIVKHASAKEESYTISNIVADGNCVFETAARLRHAPSGPYILMCSEANNEILMELMGGNQLFPNGCITFRRHPNTTIETIKDYREFKDQERKAMERKEAHNSIRSGFLGMFVLSLVECQSLAVIFAHCFATPALLVNLVPISIVVCGLVTSLILIFFIKPSILKPLSTQTWQYCLYGLILTSALAGLLIIFGVNVAAQCMAEKIAWSDAIITLTYQAVTIITAIGCIICRAVLNKRASNISRHSSWPLYTLSVLLAAVVPLLVVLGFTEQARLLLNSHILIVSAILFSIGALMYGFGCWFDKNPKLHLSRRIKMFRLVCVFVIVGLTIGLAVWTANSSNLLATGIAGAPTNHPIGS
ncbi:hypothetical protein NEHOM01_0822 [Nematocida homosporus]|uniref:uncharacterized protein n=1 Tax=Nematocida homosporus TaxID=1912981 RepID=UPI00221FBBA1|nr:uncharacterized protein NEHOM01_0822 [Nematocida homosporus]KAI5185407.1 hypothetical protein NEHOM01_0822 [Nematocida homosporus]